jgi:eukaryotic-like serine/threonine-protein kinase
LEHLRISDTSTSTQAPRSTEVERIGPYEVVATLGRGGMGSVYAVRQVSAFGVERLLAAKVLNTHLIGDRHFVDMFIDEARIATLLQHPNVVVTLDVLDDRGAPLIVMELLRGRSLDHLLKRSPSLPRSVLLAILARAARGLGAVHDARGADGQLLRVIHRDVSPQNVHVGYDGQVKVIDFGIAAARGRLTTTRTGEVKGKLAYLAPEQLSQGNLDHRTDLFALGVVAWESLAQRRLFKHTDEAGTIWAILNKPIPKLSEVAADVPPAIVDVVARCLSRAARERPESAREIAKVFAEAAGEADESAIAATMNEVFAEERARDEAKLFVGLPPAGVGERVTLPAHQPPLVVEAPAYGVSTEVPTVSAAAVTKVSKRATLRTVTFGLVSTAALAWAVFALRSAPSPASPKVATTAEAPSEAALDRFQVQVDPSVALVLVAGERRDDRPLSLSVERGGSAAISLVGRDGKISERRVSAQDAGLLLSLEEAAPVPPAASSSSGSKRATKALPPKAPTVAAKPASRPAPATPRLISNPY